MLLVVRVHASTNSLCWEESTAPNTILRVTELENSLIVKSHLSLDHYKPPLPSSSTQLRSCLRALAQCYNNNNRGIGGSSKGHSPSVDHQSAPGNRQQLIDATLGSTGESNRSEKEKKMKKKGREEAQTIELKASICRIDGYSSRLFVPRRRREDDPCRSLPSAQQKKGLFFYSRFIF